MAKVISKINSLIWRKERKEKAKAKVTVEKAKAQRSQQVNRKALQTHQWGAVLHQFPATIAASQVI